jgi:DNA-directed RNA polymerase specialized sigma24 family protein
MFANRSAISTWVYRVAVNVCLGHLRIAQRRNRLFTQEPANEASAAKVEMLESGNLNST